jgi:hypothetical protein
MRLALASRRHADSSAAVARINSSPRHSSRHVDALTQHAASARDNWGASPRALENHGVMMSEVASSPRSAIGGRGTPRAAGLASPRPTLQHRYMDPYRPGGPAAVGTPEKSNGSASVTALQAKADLAANKLANMLPPRPADAGAPIAYAHYSTTAASGSPRRMQPTGAGTTATGRDGGAPGRSAGTSFSSEMARSPGATAHSCA